MKKCPYCAEEIQDEAIKCRYCGSDLVSEPPPIPAITIKGGTQQIAKKKTHPIAVVVVIIFFLVIAVKVCSDLGSGGSNSSRSTSNTSHSPTPQPSQPQLELLSYRWHKEYDYAIAEGNVKNISSKSLENVSAIVTFETGNGSFITSDDAMIEFNPILPGQTSPFKVMARWNPEMKRAGVKFKFLMGGEINTKFSNK